MIEIDTTKNSIIWKILMPSQRRKIKCDPMINGCHLTMMIISSLFWTIFVFSFLVSIALSFAYILLVPWFYAIDFYIGIQFFSNLILDKEFLKFGYLFNGLTGLYYILSYVLKWMLELNGLLNDRKNKKQTTNKSTRSNMLKQYIGDRKQKICPVVKFKFEDD